MCCCSRASSLAARAKWRDAVVPLEHRHEDEPALAPRRHFHLGEALNKLDRLKEALTAYESAAELDPGNWRALKGVGIVLDRMGRPADAAGVLPARPRRAGRIAPVPSRFERRGQARLARRRRDPRCLGRGALDARAARVFPGPSAAARRGGAAAGPERDLLRGGAGRQADRLRLDDDRHAAERNRRGRLLRRRRSRHRRDGAHVETFGGQAFARPLTQDLRHAGRFAQMRRCTPAAARTATRRSCS